MTVHGGIKRVAQVRVALAGIGNCSAGFVQALEYYKNGNTAGLLHRKLGGYRIEDIDVVAAFDIDARKVGKDLAEAIFAKPNTAPKIMELPKTGVTVQKGELLDGIDGVIRESGQVDVSTAEPVPIVKELIETQADMLVCLLPTGAKKATEYYAEEALKAEVSFINGTPQFIASDPQWGKKYKTAGLPVVGDDLQSQMGGTIFHKGVLEMLAKRGIRVENTYQLDLAGGLEGLNTMDIDRMQFKRKLKSETIRRVLPYRAGVETGTSDYFDILENKRVGYFWIEATGFLGRPIICDITLKTEDAANGAGTLVDVVRATKVALNRVVSGPLISVSAAFFKHVPVYTSSEEAIRWFEEFIAGNRDL